jgi:CSLREA domain-containing protein
MVLFRSLQARRLATAALVVAWSFPGPARATRFDGIAVDSAADTVADDGACTLREAILSANQARPNDDCAPGAAAVADEIRFVAGTGPIVVRPLMPLPPILGPTVLRGDLQPGFAGSSIVQLDGGALSGESPGLEFRAPGSALLALGIRGFPADAVRIDAPATSTLSGVTIGSSLTGRANDISGNGGAAVHIVGGDDHRVLDNDLHGNGGLGIDLGETGRDSDDPGDADEGPNGLQNAPTIAWTLQAVDETRVSVQVSTASEAAIAFAVWATDRCHPSGAGAGSHRLATTESYVTDSSGFAEAVVVVRPPLPLGTVLSATASDKDRGISEFSPCFVHGGGQVVEVPTLGSVGAGLLGMALAAAACTTLRRRRDANAG